MFYNFGLYKSNLKSHKKRCLLCKSQVVYLLIFRTIAAVSDGQGRLDVINTGERDKVNGGQWRSMFSELVCGQARRYKGESKAN